MLDLVTFFTCISHTDTHTYIIFMTILDWNQFFTETVKYVELFQLAELIDT